MGRELCLELTNKMLPYSNGRKNSNRIVTRFWENTHSIKDLFIELGTKIFHGKGWNLCHEIQLIDNLLDYALEYRPENIE